METTVLRRDTNLLTMAKAIFGEALVTDAYVATWSYGCIKEEAMDRLSRISYKGVCEEINQDGRIIAITFCSGNTVEFSNSEWGAMAKIDLKAINVLVMGGEK
jgi:hypothetical protein